MKGDVIKDFWLQCQVDAKKSNKYGMLIFKKKGLKPIVGIDGLLSFFIQRKVELPKSLTIKYDDDTLPITFFDMDSFFNIVTPDILKKLEVKGE